MRALRNGLTVCVLTAGIAAREPVVAQQKGEELPVVPAGVAVVVLPLQSAQPTAGGAWPGGAESLDATLEAFSAELAFAFAEERGAAGWAMPRQVRERTARNPMVGVDPRHLSYQGLLRKPKKRDQIYEPLHGQLRKLAALFGARLVLLPLAIWYESEPPRQTATRGSSGEAATPAEGRGVLLLALVDVRRSAVLWHGTIAGDVAPPRSPALLATLAQRVAHQLSPS
ncbi:MAG: hypothetical protein ACE5HP_08680 [Gemmatimonadota bacterium]